MRPKDKKGFTLVELMTVLVILTIILSLFLPGLVKYVKKSRFNENSYKAKEVFYAAQTALSLYKSNGEIEKLKEYMLTGPGSGNLVDVMSTNRISSEYVGRIYYLTYNRNKNNDGTNLLLREIIGSHAFTGDILDASICMEFDPADGVVYSIFYSDNIDFFSYTNEEGSADISDMTEDERYDSYIGYYSAGNLSEPSP